MSRSSPGRYSLHDFAKNVYDVHASRPDGRELPIDATRSVRLDRAGARRRVTVRYKVFGDRVDGTYLADRHDARAHQHAGGDHVGARPRRSAVDADVRRRRPARAGRWRRSCTPGATPLEFTAPNLQYLMDSPAEFGPIVDAAVRRRAAARSASPCTTPAPTASSTLRAGRGEDRPRGRRDLRRVPGLRAGQLHVSRRLPAVRQRRRHGASQQHGDDLVGVDPQRSRRGCSTPSRTSSFTAGTSSASGRARSSRSISTREHVGRAVAGRRVHAVLRAARAAARRARRPADDRRHDSAALVDDGRDRARRALSDPPKR